MVEQQAVSRNVTGKVISNKMNKTVVVLIERKVKDPLYGKYTRRFTKMYAHDQDNACKIGDIVNIKQTRPLSKLKTWVVVEIVGHAEKDIS